MSDERRSDEAFLELKTLAWAHIHAQRFGQAEVALRKLIELVPPDDALRRWHYFGLLAGVLNSLERADEGTEMYRQALVEARLLPGPAKEADVARYMLGEQYLLFGDARDALETVEPVPEGAGHVQCLLHAVAAEALWKLERKYDARTRAGAALDAAPTDERRAELSQQLRYILTIG